MTDEQKENRRKFWHEYTKLVKKYKVYLAPNYDISISLENEDSEEKTRERKELATNITMGFG